MNTFSAFAPNGVSNSNVSNPLNNPVGLQPTTASSNNMQNEGAAGLSNTFNNAPSVTNNFDNKTNVLTNGGTSTQSGFLGVLNKGVVPGENKADNFARVDPLSNATPNYNINSVSNNEASNSNIGKADELKKNTEKNNSQIERQNGNFSFENKFNFNSSLKIRKSLTEQLCEEISMKLGTIFMCKSYLETYVFEKNPYMMNFIYLKDDMSESKNRVMNSLLLSSFCNLIWNNHIYKHEYLMSKEILSKYAKAIEKNPDKDKYCIVPIYNLEKVKMALSDQEKNIKILKKRKLLIKKNNENLLFILYIIKNNFLEIKTKAQRIIQRLLFRLDILDKLFMLKNSSVFFSNKYEFNKFKLMEILDFFNSFNIDSQLEKINKNIKNLVQEKKNLQKFLHADNEFTNSLRNTVVKNEQDITDLKGTTSEICMNLEENKEYMYHLNAFEREENYEML
ncbi:conserved Plasmodium protein, unknown function [Plasmodium knowlesi strain H]|uniref:Uncharacterized protein n=3 Tax=Plasmodium knowlesi TaxID=5850 RepID=A0A5K1VGF1_PLAKH|nr:conserved Plasmodium protein, unknown function [Plasmodium knowlesi strain H]OTN66478.1 Uncharacterized protein PKNOH_S09533600 [Plasmodium knowlesi]CAA9989971.1 conserved Plasmodium protein, unknown function [Plasmodium knowlesi strain H]SBO24557.1 conserved Plasmodium protein, unknown function [Plasmodium knowlesi strain H]SBO26342.1 conserved Plasmodium protein, unknown function [Plasmodium knowlesi strain H]VVS79445.1 conserved Plasmodium protein, unknown function [Plasmodium knowlesi s|eukprot:XP_002259986.1 hypothetical protein, conserved in Plasmodium species [Plasmodium knowlesi strain H]